MCSTWSILRKPRWLMRSNNSWVIWNFQQNMSISLPTNSDPTKPQSPTTCTSRNASSVTKPAGLSTTTKPKEREMTRQPVISLKVSFGFVVQLCHGEHLQFHKCLPFFAHLKSNHAHLSQSSWLDTLSLHLPSHQNQKNGNNIYQPLNTSTLKITPSLVHHLEHVPSLSTQPLPNKQVPLLTLDHISHFQRENRGAGTIAHHFITQGS